jgi:hypothetical protein
VNPKIERDAENVIGMYVMADVHDGEVNRLLDRSTSDEFDALLGKGRAAVKSMKSSSWSIRESAEALGMDLSELGRQLRLPQDVIHKLDLRLLHVASLPERLFDTLSDVLLVPIEHLRTYVALPPAIPAGIRFHAENGEPMVVLETFEDALLDDEDISDDDRRHWLEHKC